MWAPENDTRTRTRASRAKLGPGALTPFGGNFGKEMMMRILSWFQVWCEAVLPRGCVHLPETEACLGQLGRGRVMDGGWESGWRREERRDDVAQGDSE